MYVRDELGSFSECAYSLLLSISFLLTHREAVTGYPAGHRLVSFYTLTWCHENIYLCADALKAKECYHNLILIHMSQHTSSYEASSTLPTESLAEREEKDPNVVTSVSDFIAKIAPILEECDGTEIFYRGHADENGKLQPSIFRALNGVEKEHQLFRDMVAHTPRSFSGCKSAIDYLVQMQHYELPTRLLDVTTNPLVALYFACQPADDVSEGAIVGVRAALGVISETSDLIQLITSVVAFVLSEFDLPDDVQVRHQSLLSDIESEGIADVARSLAQSLRESLGPSEVMDILVDLNKYERNAIKRALVKIDAVLDLHLDVEGIDMTSAVMVALKNGAQTRAELGKDAQGVHKVAAVAGALAATEVGTAIAEEVAVAIVDIKPVIADAEEAIKFIAKVAAKVGAKAGASARKQNGDVYLFSIPRHKVKHYDSDAVSSLANLAKCKSEEIDLGFYAPKKRAVSFYGRLCPEVTKKEGWKDARYHEKAYVSRRLFDCLCSRKIASENWLGQIWEDIISETPRHEVEAGYLSWFNEQDSIRILLHQVREEKSYFKPLFSPSDLVNIFLVKAKNDNPRIINQAGAFFLFGLGLFLGKGADDDRESLRCNKDKPAAIPSAWVVRRLRIPAGKKQDILDELARMGITESYLFPEMDKYAKELKKKYKLS